MCERKLSSMLVVERGHLEGLITEHDVLAHVLGEHRDLASTTADAVMTRGVPEIGPLQSVEDALALVARRRCGYLAVVDDGTVCGLVSATDLMDWLLRELRLEIDDLHAYIRG
jgi:CBS domain-containing protein